MNEPIDLFGDQDFSSPVEVARFVADFLVANPEATDFYLVPEKVELPEKIADIARRAILARKAIAATVSEPCYILPVTMELTVAQPGQNREAQAREANIHRFALLDLVTGNRDPQTKAYLCQHGLTPAEYAWFMDHASSENTVLDLRSDGSSDDSLAGEYLERYQLPTIDVLVDRLGTES